MERFMLPNDVKLLHVLTANYITRMALVVECMTILTAMEVLF